MPQIPQARLSIRLGVQVVFFVFLFSPKTVHMITVITHPN